MLYAIVQHSGYAEGARPQFEKAVEHVQVTAAQAKKVRNADGLVVEDWLEGDELADRINYPADYEGLVPSALGTFSDVRIDGLRVYVPVRQVVG